MSEPLSQDWNMKGPEPTGWEAKDCAFSLSVAPGSASNSFFGMMAVLKTVSADRMAGSGCLSVMTTVLSLDAATEAIESTRNCQMPLSGVAARSSDHFTSSVVIGE